MKTVVKGVIRNEKGYLLITVLILLVVGGLILAPLLGLMSTGLLAGKVYEKKMDELYAADAGVEDAIWKIMHPESIPSESWDPCDDRPGWDFFKYPNQLSVGNKSVEVIVYRYDWDPTLCGENLTYQILSTAVTNDDVGTAAIDSSTTIEAYITETIEYQRSGIMDHIITVAENLTGNELNDFINDVDKVSLACREECVNNCTDGCGAVYDYNEIPDGCYGCGAVYNYPDAFWPTAELLAAWYGEDVEGETPYPYGTIDLGGVDMELGPLYRDGELNIRNSGASATLNLTGTLYITGDTTIYGPTSNDPADLTIDLNGQTIFVESANPDSTYALEIGKCAINGPGCIIAVGDIYFAPKGSVGTDEEPVFIFSVSGTTYLQPSGDFYGAVAGHFDVELKSGTTPTLTYPPGGFGEDFDFPILVEVDRTYSIASWEINPD
jgi:hypothetical protein